MYLRGLTADAAALRVRCNWHQNYSFVWKGCFEQSAIIYLELFDFPERLFCGQSEKYIRIFPIRIIYIIIRFSVRET